VTESSASGGNVHVTVSQEHAPVPITAATGGTPSSIIAPAAGLLDFGGGAVRPAVGATFTSVSNNLIPPFIPNASLTVLPWMQRESNGSWVTATGASFAAGYAYVLDYEFTANTGYVFFGEVNAWRGILPAFVAGGSLEVWLSQSNTRLHVRIFWDVLNATPSSVINPVLIEIDVDAPQVGGNVNVPNIFALPPNMTHVKSGWEVQDMHTWSAVEPPDIFNTGRNYRFVSVFQANTGFVFGGSHMVWAAHVQIGIGTPYSVGAELLQDNQKLTITVEWSPIGSGS
jgi:hypothetical protein